MATKEQILAYLLWQEYSASELELLLPEEETIETITPTLTEMEDAAEIIGLRSIDADEIIYIRNL